MRAKPVRHHEAVEPPVDTQDLVQQLAVVGRVLTIQFVVATHHAPRARINHRCLKRAQVELTQRCFIHLGINRHTIHFGVVGRKMLHRHRNFLRLHTAHNCRGELCC